MNNKTALHFAAEMRNKKMSKEAEAATRKALVELLLSKDKTMTYLARQEKINHKTARDLAEAKNHKEVVHILQQAEEEAAEAPSGPRSAADDDQKDDVMETIAQANV